MLDEIDVNYGRISNLIFETFDWFLSKSEELAFRNIDEWVQVQDSDGTNAISLLFDWIISLDRKVVFNNIFKL